MGFAYRLLCGIFLGVSVIAPGVSGSVMAVMMGIYDELIEIISNPFRNFKHNVIYAIPMGIGALASVAALVRVLRFLFATYPFPSSLLFLGLIGGSLPVVFREASSDPWTIRRILAMVGAFALATTVGLLAQANITTQQNPSMPYLALCGFIAGICSMTPGMSVSMILMMLGVYQPLLIAAADFVIPTIALVGCCFAVGMVLFSRLTKAMFAHHRATGYGMVLGFMCGSLVMAFPGLPTSFAELLIGVLAAGCGIAISYLFQVLGRRFRTE